MPGLLDAVAPHLVQSENIRAALASTVLGAAPFIVYATEAKAEPGDTHIRVPGSDVQAMRLSIIAVAAAMGVLMIPEFVATRIARRVRRG